MSKHRSPAVCSHDETGRILLCRVPKAVRFDQQGRHRLLPAYAKQRSSECTVRLTFNIIYINIPDPDPAYFSGLWKEVIG
jgi:hypothetical protein